MTTHTGTLVESHDARQLGGDSATAAATTTNHVIDFGPNVSAAFNRTMNRVYRVLNRRLFFVLGCQKSGTTWLEKLLDSHPQIVCRGEARLADRLLSVLRKAADEYNKDPGVFAGALHGEDVGALFVAGAAMALSGWIEDEDDERSGVGLEGANAESSPGPLAIGERTPQNARRLSELSSFFPQAKFIHIIRDGRDACVSGWFHNRRRANPSFDKKFPSIADYAIMFAETHWLPYVCDAREFGARRPDHYLEVRYEDLLADGVAQMRRILTFIGVDDGAASIRHCLEAASFESLSGGRTRGVEDANSHFRKGVVGDWRTHFDEDALNAFHIRAAPLLETLGYEVVERAPAAVR